MQLNNAMQQIVAIKKEKVYCAKMNESYSADFLPLLSATARLIDIHDSSHSIGVPYSGFSESRGENSGGLWLDVGARVLEYLYDEDINSNEGWVNLSSFIEDTASLLDLTDIDIRFVISHLSTPTRLATCVINTKSKQRVTKTTKQTALLERPLSGGGDRARITDVGRRAIMLSQRAQKWMYSHHDANKITEAIEIGDFGSVPQLCFQLAQSIRSFIHQIRRVIERPDSEETEAVFVSNSERYLETIKKVTSGIEFAQQKLHSPETQEVFLIWTEANEDKAIDSIVVQNLLLEITQLVESLNRLFARLIKLSLDTERKVLGCINFDKVAIELAMRPFEDVRVNTIFQSIGPWGNSLVFASPDDFTGCIKTKTRKQQVQPKVICDDSSEMVLLPIDKFINKHRDEIIKRIYEAPISIAEAVKLGWAEVDEELFTGQLIGTFANPDWLRDKNTKICITVKDGGLNVSLPNGKVLMGDDLILSVENNEV